MEGLMKRQNPTRETVSSGFVQLSKETPEPAHREHPVLSLQRAIGNQAVQRMLQTGVDGRTAGLAGSASPRFGHEISRILIHARPIQTKLQISEPGDEYEREADRIADQVMGAPSPHAVGSAPLRIQRFSRQPAGQAGEAPASVNQVLASPGRPLEPALRQDMEQRFGFDFSQVRVHTGTAAEQSARDVTANAYTVGHNVVFGAGRFTSGTHEGRRLIAHELTHVVQQSDEEDIPSPLLQRQPSLTPTRQGKILSLKEISADPAREKARKNTGQMAAKACRSISAGANKKNCPATLEPGLQVTIVAERAGGAWLQIVTPEQLPGFGPTEPIYVMALFVQELPAIEAPEERPQASGPITKDILRLDQTVRIKGLARKQPNYVDYAMDRIVGSPSLDPYITLIPRTGITGHKVVLIPKGDFYTDNDPLSGPHGGNNQVYVSRDMAEAVVADLNSQIPNMPNYTYYLRDGIIFPTILSDTTIPNLMPFIRKKKGADLQEMEALADLDEAILWWYIGARFPLKVGRGKGPEVAIAGKAAFDTAKVSDELFAATKSLSNAGQKMLAAGRQLSAMGGLTAAQKVDVMLEFFNRIGFAISKAGVVDDGARFVMWSEDTRYAFAFIKDTSEILYAKFDMDTLQFVWSVLK